jgi:tetratricopeptide (TPR) repeat protein
MKTSEIVSIRYDGQPADMMLAESRESAGILNEAAELYKKAAVTAAGKPFIIQAAVYHQAKDVAELALADPVRAAEAISLLELFVKSYPNCRHIVPALETLARLQLQKGDAGVEKTIGELAKQPQEVDRAAVLRAKVLAKWGDHEKAIAELESMIKNAPDGSTRQREARLAKAESLVVLKKFAEAEADVRAVIKATPTEDYQAQSAAYNTLGDCLRAAGKPKDALYAYLHTDLLYSKDKEQHPRALANASQLFRELKRDDRADDLW